MAAKKKSLPVKSLPAAMAATATDGLFAISDALNRLADAVEAAHPFPLDLSVGKAITEGLADVASSIRYAKDKEENVHASEQLGEDDLEEGS